MKRIISLILVFVLCSCATNSSNSIVSVSKPEKQDITTESLNSIYDFMTQNQTRFISDSNSVYSPINVYIAFAMLSEITSGSTSAEVQTVLNQSNKEIVKNLIESTYTEQDSTILLGNSLWMNEDINYKKDTLKTLSTYYYASSFSGKMGSTDYDKQIQSWVNEQTNNLLEDQVNSIKTNTSTVLELLSTIYFKGSWADEFDENNNKEEVFHTSSKDVEVEYMCSSKDSLYYKGNGYSMISLPFSSGERMWLILPDTSLSDLTNTDYLTQIQKQSGEYGLVNLELPKFDITSLFNLKEIMQDMGIQKVFSGGDFSNLTEDVGVELSEAKHNARIRIDEEGCEGAAYTEMNMKATAMLPDEEIDFVLNRPFVFVVTSNQNVPLFSGTVENPENE